MQVSAVPRPVQQMETGRGRREWGRRVHFEKHSNLSVDEGQKDLEALNPKPYKRHSELFEIPPKIQVQVSLKPDTLSVMAWRPHRKPLCYTILYYTILYYTIYYTILCCYTIILEFTRQGSGFRVSGPTSYAPKPQTQNPEPYTLHPEP